MQSIPPILNRFKLLLYTSILIPNTTNTPNKLETMVIASWYAVKTNIAENIDKTPKTLIAYFQNVLVAKTLANCIKKRVKLMHKIIMAEIAKGRAGFIAPFIPFSFIKLHQ